MTRTPLSRSKVKVTGGGAYCGRSRTACYYYAPTQGGIKRWCCLTSLSDILRLSDICLLHPVGRRRVRPAGWMARIGWSGPARPAWLKAAAARFCCRPGRGYIVAAARLQLVIIYKLQAGLHIVSVIMLIHFITDQIITFKQTFTAAVTQVLRIEVPIFNTTDNSSQRPHRGALTWPVHYIHYKNSVFQLLKN